MKKSYHLVWVVGDATQCQTIPQYNFKKQVTMTQMKDLLA